MANDLHVERILVIDFGAQYTQLIARRIREAGVYCEIHPFDAPQSFIRDFAPRGIVLSGGPETVTEDATPRIPDVVFELNEKGTPVLGICYGIQALAQQLGGRVQSSNVREFGHARVRVQKPSRLFDGLPSLASGELDVWMSHGDKVIELPTGFEVVASTASAPIAAMQNAARATYAVQFHPEVTHTSDGALIIRRFARDICGCRGLWTPANIIADAIETIRKQVGDERVVLGLSGGVDSSVVAALLSRAIGEQLTCVFVDHGLLRYREREEVVETFGPSNALKLNLVVVDAAAEFLGNLRGAVDPEDKRKIIGRTFIDVFDREAHKIAGVKWLAQGTIYPDVIESAATKFGKAHVIKSHHNVGGLPERMKLKLVEPLRELFKDEVREVGAQLGLPREVVWRQPFPGPGLAVRILGAVTPQRLQILREADWVVIDEMKKADLYYKVWQTFAVLLPVKTVGVMGDERTYDNVIAIRAVESVDGMTADWVRLPYDLLARLSTRIINEVKGVNRVCFDISSKPP
ncbi:MAG TPA: glutamine-hydrolyzing GMP synthase, partial [Pseudomonadales bacterium]|nr:glutamine-hydrolyzing GMP synthase [Pseudomonadales bacterium]